MQNEHFTDEQVKEILKLLENAIEQGPWEASNFLKIIGNKLRDVHGQIAKQMANINEIEIKSKPFGKSPGPGQQEVFISLYTAEGSSLQAWERILINLPRQMISRPIYADEESVKNLIKTKVNRANEAYVSMFIDKNNLLTVASDKIAYDKLGKPLLTLKDRALDLNNVNYFVHLESIYYYSNGRLILIN